MDVENTDFERRVLAREQILQVLIAQWQKRNQNFWTGYSKDSPHMRADEQDYTDTAAYAEQFIQQVVRLRDKGRRS